ncbi:hypothetical protein [Gilvimarinus chinensis]|uniref:hypothetical protein n=1 Tax=Gilvimarinus chinensis TaxID=396005 RepID=UPI00039AACCE|nr:hypothetical protein [Gilvimarinus chinensis]
MIRSIIFTILFFYSLGLNADVDVPEGFKLQKLEATDGSIAIPEGWYYQEGSTNSGIIWTISKEDPKEGYETGQRIQMLFGVEKGTKKSKKDFVDSFIQNKRKISKIVKDCTTTDLGMFYRTCLEVVEPPSEGGVKKEYHILYSLFWAKEMDLVVLVTFGAPEEEWAAVESIANTMTVIELIGPNLGK